MYLTDRNSKDSPIAIALLVLFNMIYLAWVILFVGWRSDHLAFIGIWTILFLYSPSTRNMFYTFIYLIVYWLIYDSMRVMPNYLFNDVNIIEPYIIDKDWFGPTIDGLKMTWNEYFQVNTNKFLDFITGVFYLSWVPVPFAYCVYLYYKGDYKNVIGFTICFLTVNLLGWVLYYTYPAAPPWYYAKYGTEFIPDMVGDPAGLSRFDDLFGIQFFNDLYSKSSAVFGAIPSLHAAFPLILSYFSLKRKNRVLTLLFIIILIGILFSAIYTNHHYIIDVLLGLTCAILALIIYEQIVVKYLKPYLITPILEKTNNIDHA